MIKSESGVKTGNTQSSSNIYVMDMNWIWNVYVLDLKLIWIGSEMGKSGVKEETHRAA